MFRLMLVTDRKDTAGRNLIDVVRAAVEGGADCVQVREKDLDDALLSRLTLRIMDAVRGRAAVVLNGHPDISRTLGAGVHLPEGDAVPDFLKVAATRARKKQAAVGHGGPALRPHELGLPVWGRSVHSVEGAETGAAEDPDYLLLGTIYETTSKPGLEGSGVDLIQRVVNAVGDLPVMAIGGIDVYNVGEAVQAGACGVAVRSALLKARNPARAAENLLRAMG